MNVAWIFPLGSSRSSLGLSPTRGRRNWPCNTFPHPLAVPPPLCQAPPTKSRLPKPREKEAGETEQWFPIPSNPKGPKAVQYEAVLHRVGGFSFATHDMDFPSLAWRALTLTPKGSCRGVGNHRELFLLEVSTFEGWESSATDIPSRGKN